MPDYALPNFDLDPVTPLGDPTPQEQIRWEGYLEESQATLKTLLDKYEMHPAEWPLYEQLRLAAGALDAYDIKRGVINQHDSQDSLRQAADILEAVTGFATGLVAEHGLTDKLSTVDVPPSQFAGSDSWQAYLNAQFDAYEQMTVRNEDITPAQWPLPDRVRLNAAWLDVQDDEKGETDTHEVQDSLRHAADVLDMIFQQAADVVSVYSFTKPVPRRYNVLYD